MARFSWNVFHLTGLEKKKANDIMSAVVAGKKYTVDLCRGPLLIKIVLFALPIMGSLLLQLAFNSADLIVVGRYASGDALAAVGATSTFNALVTNLFFGMASGASVVMANYYGSKSKQEMSETIHTSMLLSLIGSVILMFIGLAVSRPVLELLDTPPEIIDSSVLYIRLCFLGMPFTMVYNFGSALLRAAGDTKRPLYFLASAGVINVLLNLFFVIVLHMTVEGVAIATVISQGFSAALVWNAIANTEEIGGLYVKNLHINPFILKKILAFGIPSALQSISFCLANMVIQRSINSFGALAVAGNTAALSIEYFISTGAGALYEASISFTAQNLGGKQYGRIKRAFLYNMVLSVIVVTVTSFSFLYFGHGLLKIFNENEEIIAWGYKRMIAIFPLYFTGAMMNITSGTLRGCGKPGQSFLCVFFGACIFRLVWIFTVFPLHHTLGTLLMCFPISWVLISMGCGALIYNEFHKYPVSRKA